MPWQKGQSGNPGGRGVEKPWRDALRLAANEEDPARKVKKLRIIAEQVVQAAMGGDMQAAKEIGDRLDGKAAQAIIGDEDAAPIRHVFEWLTADSGKPE